jgi:hypothetical protein
MTIDFSTDLYDPVYTVLGVPATLTAGVAGTVAITVIDETRSKTNVQSGVETSSVGPGAFVRIPELVAKGITRSEWIGATLTFNGRSWIVREAPVQGSPNGEDLGEVRFLLKEAHLG